MSPSTTASCDVNVAPPSSPIASTGATGAVAVNATSNCSWSASSQTAWIELTETSGVGAGAVKFRVAANTGSGRTGTFTVADEIVTVTQAAVNNAPTPACEFSISPRQLAVNGSGGPAEIVVSSTSADCAWTASSQSPWITVSGNAAGSGNGAVTLAIAAHSGADRTGTVLVAGQTVTVAQATACSYAVTPTTYTAPPTAIQNASFAVSTGAGCAWTASSSTDWIRVLHGASASGNLTVIVAVDANAGGQRSGELTIAGRSVTIHQQSWCSFAVDPGVVDDDGTGGTAEVAVSAPAGCGWSAVSNAPWITILSGKSGSGSGIVAYEVAPLPSGAASRTGTLTVAGLAVTVRQAGK